MKKLLEASSWGKRGTEIDIRALRRYQKFLASTAFWGETIIFVQIIALILATIWLYTTANFENIIFYDGTDVTCVMNGDTGGIIAVE